MCLAGCFSWHVESQSKEVFNGWLVLFMQCVEVTGVYVCVKMAAISTILAMKR